MDKIPPYDYLKGEAFTKKLKEVTGVETLLEMSDAFEVPKTTFSAWNTHNRTSHELIVRLHLALGIPIQELALSEEEQKKLPNYSYDLPPAVGLSTIQSYDLVNGQLEFNCLSPYTEARLKRLGVWQGEPVEVMTSDSIYIIDKASINAMSGKYLIDIDGNLSINRLQRLPGKKLAVVFGDSTIEVSEEDIKVVGRVAVVLEKV